MNKVIKSIMLISFVFVLSACGGFNTETAKKDSREALEQFFSSYDELETIVESSDVKEVSALVENEFKPYFTKNFMKTIENKILENDKKKSKFTDPELFFIEQSYNNDTKEFTTNFFNLYDIELDRVNKENQIVSYKIRPTDVGLLKNGGLIEMRLEDRTWKINSLEQ